MTQHDVILDAPEAAPRRRPAVVRLALWSMLTLFGTLAALVLLADPRVTGRIGAAATSVQARFGGSESAALPAPAPTATRALPSVVAPRAVAARTGAAQPIFQAITPGAVGSAEAAKPAPRPAVRVMPQNRIPVRRAGVTNGG